MQMSLVLTWGARVPTVRMGRMVSFYFILEKKKKNKKKPTHTHTHIVTSMTLPADGVPCLSVV